MKTKQIVTGPVTKKAAGARKKAVAIARDVIAQLRIQKLKATAGCYIDVDLQDNLGNPIDLDSSDSFQKTFKNSTGHCNVCAIGAVFLGYVNRYNRVTNEDIGDMYDNSEVIIHYLSDAFSKDELRFMERIFEGEWIGGEPDWVVKQFGLRYDVWSNDYDIDDVYEEFEDRCDAYRTRYKNDDELLRAIMLNVIRNNGIFKLPQRV